MATKIPGGIISRGETLGYGAPFESPIETEFGMQLRKFLRDPESAWVQTEVQAGALTFRVDIAARDAAGRLIGFECDGREFHEDTEVYDYYRDLLIIATGAFHAIYRLRGHDIWRRRDDCIFAIAAVDQGLFSQASKARLHSAASDLARDVCPEWRHGRFAVRSGYKDKELGVSLIERRCADVPKDGAWIRSLQTSPIQAQLLAELCESMKALRADLQVHHERQAKARALES